MEVKIMKKMNGLQKLMALALALIMIFSGTLSVPAQAASLDEDLDALLGILEDPDEFLRWLEDYVDAEDEESEEEEPAEEPAEVDLDTPATGTEHEINNISSTYITDGGEYTVAVGDALTLYHPRTPTSPYYAYTWCVTEGEEHVMLDRAQGTCQVVGLTEGDVTLECGLDYTVVYYPGSSDTYNYTYTITIHVVGAEHSGENDYGTMSGKLCPRCHGHKTVEMSGEKVVCDVCNGTGLWP
jgi:hypothetical protein